MKRANLLGFHLDIFSILTQQNLSDIDIFETYIQKELGFLPIITYHPRKPPAYLQTHPVSNIVGETVGFDFLTPNQLQELSKKRNVFPPATLGCYQISIASDGKVYGCCEGTNALGRIRDPINQLINQLEKRLDAWELLNSNPACLGCSQPDFMCGLKVLCKSI